MRDLRKAPRRKREALFPKPLLTNRDPGYRGIKHIKAIQNEEGFYKP